MTSRISCTPEEFRDAPRNGLGRAVKYVHASPAKLVREPLLYACTRYVGYDMQCEGGRGPWFYEMIALTGEPDWYCAEALKALEQTRDNSQRLAQPRISGGIDEILSEQSISAQSRHCRTRKSKYKRERR